MDISKIMDLLGLGENTPEDLEAAMEKQILPESATARTKPSHPTTMGGEQPRVPMDDLPGGEREDVLHYMKVGRCPSCGDLIVDQAGQRCAWCNTACHPEQDGFHLVHVALGTFQERHCFCSDECFEAFRRMYPARVHRNCYERPCADCTFCTKRYTDEFDGLPGQEQDTRPPASATPEKA